jgi:hypothetical protein
MPPRRAGPISIRACRLGPSVLAITKIGGGKNRLAARMDQPVLRLPNHMNASQM